MPHFTHAKINLDSITDEIDRQVLINIATRHNALVEATSLIKDDIDGISGKTKEEKAMTHEAMNNLRYVFSKLHSKRHNIFLGTAQIGLSVWVFKMFGIQPEVIGRILEAILKANGV